MKEFALALSALTASHHHWPIKPPLEPAAIIVRSAPVQTRYVDLRELRKAIDRYCREQSRLNESARRSRAQYLIIQPLFGRHLYLEVPRSKGEVREKSQKTAAREARAGRLRSKSQTVQSGISRRPG